MRTMENIQLYTKNVNWLPAVLLDCKINCYKEALLSLLSWRKGSYVPKALDS